MPQTFFVSANSSGTVELTSLAKAFKSDGSTGALDALFYIMSLETANSKEVLAASDPGVDAIPIFITDSNGATGQLAADIKLALSQGDLDTAVAGAAIDGPVQVLSGVAQALPVWARIDPSELAEGTYNDLTISFGPVVERTV